MDNPAPAPKFRNNQVVYWGNGAHQYVRVAYSSRVSTGFCCLVRRASEPMLAFSDRWSETVSEDVLRPLTAEEIGI